ncbi:MAG: hypothetical protein JWN03_7298 [Nocardia sp.]|uniref:hypothetical protein n=1 Tax=Nocardia sp. TaxID=1821 RepID=UPI00261C8140|nr:hypothetical protein [Nocardia sp.]MCU1647023.1 hypothetical protein [Nocardia sp.]
MSTAVSRPTARWRALVEKNADYEPLFPAPMIAGTELAIYAFESDLGPNAAFAVTQARGSGCR